MREAQPPGRPARESSTPPEIFPDVHMAWLRHEHIRSAAFIERCTGCIDLRDVVSVSHAAPDSGLGKKTDRSLEIALPTGGTIIFEAHSSDDADEWVDRLENLRSYWKRRHRVE